MKRHLPSTIYSLMVAAFVASSAYAQEIDRPLPVLALLTPQNEQVLSVGEAVVATFAAIDFRFSGDDGALSGSVPSSVHEGHAHIWVDDLSYDHAAARELVSGDPISLGSLPRGTHTVALELTLADHGSFSPRVRASAEFSVVESHGDAVTGIQVIRSLGGSVAILLLVLGGAAAGLWYWLRRRGGLAIARIWTTRVRDRFRRKDDEPPKAV